MYICVISIWSLDQSSRWDIIYYQPSQFIRSSGHEAYTTCLFTMYLHVRSMFLLSLDQSSCCDIIYY